MSRVLIVLLIGYVVSSVLAVFFTPSGDPYTMLLVSVPLFAVLEASYWIGYVRGTKTGKRLG